jgi:UDP-N-acetylmuramoyl-tripeptide--D-alanyl-D-alanine ligase
MVAPAHLEGFGSIERVAQAKGEIAEALPANGIFYVNEDDARCRDMGERYWGRKVRFGTESQDTGRLDVALRHAAFAADSELELDIAPIGRLRLPLAIRAHANNVLLSVAIGLQHGIEEFEAPLRAACAGAARFKVCSVGPLTILDDTYNANPASMAAALQALAERPGNGQRIAALGAMLELGDQATALHADLGETAAKAGVSHLFMRGPNACDTIAAARAAQLPHAEVVEDHQAIAAAIHQAARPGDTVLVKGSRGMRMEKVIEALAALYSSEA